MTPSTQPGLEAFAASLVSQLDAHLAAHDFLLGALPLGLGLGLGLGVGVGLGLRLRLRLRLGLGLGLVNPNQVRCRADHA